MRSNIRMTCLGLLVLATTGCESTRWNFLKREPGNDIAAAKPGAAPNVINLVNYLNENAKRVNSVRFDDVSVDATMNAGTLNPQTFALAGRLLAEKPRNFRLKASVLGKDEADIGSNAQEFWFWIARNPEPRQYYCAYKDLDAGRVQMMPLPIQPEWVMETLGLGPYGPAEKYQLELDKDGKMLRLIEKSRSPSGQAVRKVIVMNRKEVVQAPVPQVTAYLLVDDATGQEVCSAHITAVKVFNGVVLPSKLELRMPAQKMKMALKMDRVTVNAALPSTAFVRPQMTGIAPFNLATGRNSRPCSVHAGESLRAYFLVAAPPANSLAGRGFGRALRVGPSFALHVRHLRRSRLSVFLDIWDRT